MAEIDNPILRAQVQQRVRPLAELARNLLVQAQADRHTLGEMVASLSEEALDTDIIVDGITDAPPLTVGDLRNCVGVLNDIVDEVETDPRLASILAACVRPARVVSGG